MLVSGIGTGGTISGVSRYIKKEMGNKDPLSGSGAFDQRRDYPSTLKHQQRCVPGRMRFRESARDSFQIIRWTCRWWIEVELVTKRGVD